MKRILLAGASGQLGRGVIAELKQQGYVVRALTREAAKLRDTGADEIHEADLADTRRLEGAAAQCDAVISCAGASMDMNTWRDRRTFNEIDWQGNLNLLTETRRARAGKFVYVSLAGGERLRQLEYADAHERFVESLRASGLAYTVVRPTGFFSFMLEILRYAEKGAGLLLGDGQCLTNPIHEGDVARACVESLAREAADFPIGGPETFTRRAITELAFATIGQPARLLPLPPGVFRAMVSPLRLVNPRIHALMAFGAAITQVNCIAPAYGRQRLSDYFRKAR
ncbi:MAG: SDR family oxidoreductase [Blastocatellia bacterium]